MPGYIKAVWEVSDHVRPEIENSRLKFEPPNRNGLRSASCSSPSIVLFSCSGNTSCFQLTRLRLPRSNRPAAFTLLPIHCLSVSSPDKTDPLPSKVEPSARPLAPSLFPFSSPSYVEDSCVPVSVKFVRLSERDKGAKLRGKGVAAGDGVPGLVDGYVGLEDDIVIGWSRSNVAEVTFVV